MFIDRMVMVLVEVAADTQVLAAVHGRSVWQRDNGVVVGRAGFYLYAQVALYARDRWTVFMRFPCTFKEAFVSRSP